MSKLTELFKTIGNTLHLPELAKPLWEAMIAAVDRLEAKFVELEAKLASSVHALDPALVEKLNSDWATFKAGEAARADHLASLAAAEAKATAEAVHVVDPANSGAVASNTVPSPAAQPEAAVAGDPTPAATTTTAVDSNI